MKALMFVLLLSNLMPPEIEMIRSGILLAGG
jgi:hypothetical protein